MDIKIDFEQMRETCLLPIESFVESAKKHPGATVFDTKHGPLIYYNRGSDVLSVAHLDNTPAADGNDHFATFTVNSAKDTFVYTARLDDRLGAYIVMYLLPKLGVNCDILLTTSEEVHNSTAQYFEPPEGKVYNWMFQFDRRGDDAVTYQYGCEEFLRELRNGGYKIGQGSYSCTKELGHLGIAGINIGCGYHDEHTPFAFASMKEMTPQVEKLVDFYNLHKGRRFLWSKPTYTPPAAQKGQTSYHNDDGEWDYNYGRWPGGKPSPSKASLAAGEKTGRQAVTQITKPLHEYCVCCEVIYAPITECMRETHLCQRCFQNIHHYPYVVAHDFNPHLDFQAGDSFMVDIPLTPEYAAYNRLDESSGIFEAYDPNDPDYAWVWLDAITEADGESIIKLQPMRLPVETLVFMDYAAGKERLL